MRLATQRRQRWPAAPVLTDFAPLDRGLVDLDIQQLSSQLFDFVNEAAYPTLWPLSDTGRQRLQTPVASGIVLRH
jgi:hypothetical protein